MDLEALAGCLGRARQPRVVVVLGEGDYAAYRESSPTARRALEREARRVVGVFTSGCDLKVLAEACQYVEDELFGARRRRRVA